jgi:ATP-binding cassette subfamily B protein
MQKKSMLGEYKTVIPYFSRYKGQYTVGLVVLLIVDAAQMLIPQWVRHAIDLIASGAYTMNRVIFYSGCMVATMAVIAVGRFLWRFFIHGSSRRIEEELRNKIFAHLLSLDYVFYRKYKIGDLMARTLNDLNAVRMSIGFGLVAMIDGTAMAISILVIIFVQDAKTAALAVLPLPFITALIMLFGSAVGRSYGRSQAAYSAMSDVVSETFRGIGVVQSFVKEPWFTKKFAATNDEYKAANMILARLFGFFFPMVTFLSGLTTLAVLFLGGRRVIEGFMSPGSLVALLSYMQMLIWPVLGAGFTVTMLQRGAVSLGRINEVLHAKAKLIVWQLQAYHIKLSQDPSVIYIAGFSDRLLAVIKSIIEDTGNQMAEIEKVEL